MEIKISNRMASDLNEVVINFGFETDSEFIVEAIKDKILQLKKLMFINIINEVASGLKKKEISCVDILEDFEKHR